MIGRKPHRKDGGNSREKEGRENHAGRLAKGVHLSPMLRKNIKILSE